MMQNQADRREHTGHFAQTEMSELKAIANLIRGLFGNIGLLESGPDEIGCIYAGYYLDPPSVPSHRRARRLIFRGYKFREFAEQVKLFRGMSKAEQDSVFVNLMPGRVPS